MPCKKIYFPINIAGAFEERALSGDEKVSFLAGHYCKSYIILLDERPRLIVKMSGWWKMYESRRTLLIPMSHLFSYFSSSFFSDSLLQNMSRLVAVSHSFF